MSMFRTSFIRALRGAAGRPFGSPTVVRSYAGGKKDMSAVQGDQGTGEAMNASNVGNPGSDSANEQSLKTSRGTEDSNPSRPDTASTQKPLDNPTGAATAQQGEDTSTQAAFKQDPDKSEAEKRKNVEKMGQKPLDAADK